MKKIKTEIIQVKTKRPYMRQNSFLAFLKKVLNKNGMVIWYPKSYFDGMTDSYATYSPEKMQELAKKFTKQNINDFIIFAKNKTKLNCHTDGKLINIVGLFDMNGKLIPIEQSNRQSRNLINKTQANKIPLKGIVVEVSCYGYTDIFQILIPANVKIKFE